MRKINLLVFFVLLMSFASKAQDSLYFSNTHYNVAFLDTTNSFTISDTIYNLGSTPFSGAYVTFQGRVNNTTLISSPRLSYDSIIPSDTLYTGGNNYKAIAFTVNSDTAPPFVIGTNAVVIWPVITINNTNIPINPADSIYINVTYDTLTGIAGTALAKMYIFQIPGHLNISFGDAENLVQQVRIVDILGQNMYTGPADKSRNIPTAGWNIGVYLCEITTYSGEKRVIKFRLE